MSKVPSETEINEPYQRRPSHQNAFLGDYFMLFDMLLKWLVDCVGKNAEQLSADFLEGGEAWIIIRSL